jgi:effector-binding domain-containing protein
MTYEITRHAVPDLPIVSMRERLPVAELPAFFGRAWGELYGYLGRLGVTPTGEPFAMYHAFGPDGIDLEACVAHAGGVPSTDRIDSRVLPATTVAETLHVGSYDELGNAYNALTEWVAREGFEPVGPHREIYLNEPGPDVPPATYRTLIQMPIAEAAVAVG